MISLSTLSRVDASGVILIMLGVVWFSMGSLKVCGMVVSFVEEYFLGSGTFFVNDFGILFVGWVDFLA